MPGDRVARVCCAGTDHHYQDPRGDAYENEDTCLMLCQMRSGGLVKIRVDMLSDRPHAQHNYQLQGTDGCYESARAPGEKNRIWLRSRSKWHPQLAGDWGPEGDCSTVSRSQVESEHGTDDWTDLDDISDEFAPDSWRRYEELAARSGHGGGDLIEMIDFVEAIREGNEPEIGIHEAMDMTLPGLISQQSIADAGRWLDVPDSREW